MSLKIDRLQLEIIINNDQARKSLRELEEESKRLKKDLRKVPEGSDEWKRINNRLKSIQSQHDKIIEKLGIEKLTTRELGQRQRELNAIMRNMDPSTKAYKDLEKQLIAIKNRQAQLRGSTTKTGASLKKLARSFNNYFGIVTAGIATLTGVFFSAKEWVKGLVGLDDALANVMKTTDLTRKEARELYTDFKYFNTRTPRKELLQLAEAAGRLGIRGKKNINDFVESANKINVALGDDLGDSSGKAILEVGKITSNLKIAEKYGVDYARALEMAGSSINELAANTKAQAPYIIDWSKRLSGVAQNAKIAAQDIFGMATTFDESGQTLEMSATAVNKVLVDMFTDTEKYAKMAGMGLEEFSALLNTDANEAFIRMLENLHKNDEGFKIMATRMDELGIDGSRAVQAISSLAANTDKLRQNQALANKSLQEGVSLTNEYNLKNDNMAGNLEKIGRYMRALFVNSTIISGVEKLVGVFAKWVEIPISEKLKQEQIDVNSLVVEMTNANTTADRRNKIYETLKGINPDIVEGINTEAISVDKLRINLQKYNEEMINKIALQDSQNELNAHSERLGKATGERVRKELKLSNQLVTIKNQAARWDKKGADEIGKILLSSIDVVEKYKQIRKIAEGISVENKLGVGWLNRAEYTSSKIVSARKEEKKLQEEQTAALEKYKKMYSSIMGDSNKQSGASGFIGPPPPPDYSPSVNSIESLNAQIKILEDARKKIAETDKEALAENEKQTRALKKRVEDLTISYKKQGKTKKDEQQQYQQQLINSTKTLIDQEDIAHNERLKKAGLFGVAKEKMTAEQLKALEVLEGIHNRNIAKINAEANTKSIDDFQAKFDKETKIRKLEHEKALMALGADKEARAKLDKEFQQEEKQRMITHLEELTKLLNKELKEGAIDGLSIEDAMLTDDEKESLTNKILDLQVIIAQLKAELSGDSTENNSTTYGGAIANFLFGKDWDKMTLADKIKAVGDLAIKTLSDINKIISNSENQQLMDFQNKISKKKELLNKQLNDGIISYEEYTARTSQLDADLDKKKRKIDHDQAVRAKALAIMSAVLNTAVGVARAFKDYEWPISMAVAAIVGALGAVQIGVAASAPVPAYATGNYADILAQDGKTYHAKTTDSNHKSGLYSEPTYVPDFGIFGETKKPELVFNPEDTKTLLNTPGLIEAINHTLGVQQFASGNAREIIKENNTVTQTFTDPALIELMQDIREYIKKPARAELVVDEDYIRTHNKVKTEYDAFQKRVGM